MWASQPSSLCVAHPLAGHYGQSKTLYQVHLNYYWPGLLTYVKNYCKLCTICSCAKPVCHRPYGLLKQLPIPKRLLEK